MPRDADRQPNLEQGLEPTEVLSPPAPSAKPNAYLDLAFSLEPGHGRQWGAAELAHCLRLLTEGYSIVRACAISGVERMSLYTRMDNDETLAQAVLQAKNRYGVDGLDDTVQRIVDGTLTDREGKPRHAPHPAYVAMAYKRRGHLLDGQPSPGAVAINAAQVSMQVLALTLDQARALLPGAPTQTQTPPGGGGQASAKA